MPLGRQTEKQWIMFVTWEYRSMPCKIWKRISPNPVITISRRKTGIRTCSWIRDPDPRIEIRQCFLAWRYRAACRRVIRAERTQAASFRPATSNQPRADRPLTPESQNIAHKYLLIKCMLITTHISHRRLSEAMVHFVPKLTSVSLHFSFLNKS